MKVAWKKSSGNKRSRQLISSYPNLPFDSTDEKENKSEEDIKTADQEIDTPKDKPAETLGIDLELAESFQSQGNKLAEDGRYREALGKWEAALTLTPERAILHEQKAQVLLEIGDAWNALKAATRATELESSWAEAWITLGRAQLNFGEPDKSLESFSRCLAIRPDSIEAQADREAALRLVKKRKHLHTSGLMNATETRYKVGDKID